MTQFISDSHGKFSKVIKKMSFLLQICDSENVIKFLNYLFITLFKHKSLFLLFQKLFLFFENKMSHKGPRDFRKY